ATIPDKRVNTTITLSGTSDTSCNPSVFEGTLTAVVSTASGIGTGKNYDFDWTPPTGFTLPADVLDRSGASQTFTQMNDGAYSLKATNVKTRCVSTKSVTILNSGKPVWQPVLAKKDRSLCNQPDQSVEVTSVKATTSTGAALTPAPSFADFTYVWTENGTALSSLATTTTKVDVTNLPTIDLKTYGVKAIRTTGSPGNGCESAVVTATITDQRKFPVVTLTSTANTACDGQFDGSITATATTTGFAAAATNYTWNWKTAPSGTIFDPGQAVSTSLSPKTFASSATQLLQNGGYSVTVTNESNKCSTDANVTITKSTVLPVIASVSALNKLKCTADGKVEVGQIDLGTLTNVNHNEFDFSWYQTAITSPSLTLSSDPTNLLNDRLDKGNFPAIDKGTYFVTVTRKSGFFPGSKCESLPFKAEIKDKSVKPVVQLSSLANSACGNRYNAEITVSPSTTGFPVATTQYRYEWLTQPSGTNFDDPVTVKTSPAVFASSNTQFLRDGNYSVKVTNLDNECEVT
ncbi:MAG: hypothetical protein ACKO3B_02820, partial [Bacteroidota bacterium]